MKPFSWYYIDRHIDFVMRKKHYYCIWEIKIKDYKTLQLPLFINKLPNVSYINHKCNKPCTDILFDTLNKFIKQFVLGKLIPHVSPRRNGSIVYVSCDYTIELINIRVTGHSNYNKLEEWFSSHLLCCFQDIKQR